jgi:hypothetical protein
MNEPQLYIGPSSIKHSELCVRFRGSAAGDNAQLSSYPTFWTSDQREAEIFVAEATPHLQELDRLWQSRQFDALDKLFQEIENATLTKRTGEEQDEKLHNSITDTTGFGA